MRPRNAWGSLRRTGERRRVPAAPGGAAGTGRVVGERAGCRAGPVPARRPGRGWGRFPGQEGGELRSEGVVLGLDLARGHLRGKVGLVVVDLLATSLVVLPVP